LRVRFARNRLIVYATAAVLVAVGTLVRTPYSLLLPGQAVDLRDVVRVRGHAPPVVRLDMTDVSFVPNVAPFALAAGLTPGARIVRTDKLVPGGLTDSQYERVMRDSMSESQAASVYVAERAAGFAVGPVRERVVVGSIDPQSHARGALRDGDELTSIDGRPVSNVQSVRGVLELRRPGAGVRVAYVRDGVARVSMITTISLDGRARLGVYLGSIVHFPAPPVPVTFRVPNISGSSGGLMFALEVYETLHPAKRTVAPHIAGTGTLDAHGAVGAIEGTVQKLSAARRAGASIFLVPMQNFGDVASSRDIHIIPVRTFSEAVAAIER
jgi:PDZ domain-containing protein